MNIEIGKQYIIKGHPYAPNNGLIVTVTGYLGEGVTDIEGFGIIRYLGVRWATDKPVLSLCTHGTGDIQVVRHTTAQYLHPLDNDTGFEAGSWEALKDIFTPSELVTNQKEVLTNAN
jgi:hypothetical protein